MQHNISPSVMEHRKQAIPMQIKKLEEIPELGSAHNAGYPLDPQTKIELHQSMTASQQQNALNTVVRQSSRVKAKQQQQIEEVKGQPQSMVIERYGQARDA